MLHTKTYSQLTNEEKDAIVKDYLNKDIPVKEIREKHGIFSNDLARLIRERNIPFRVPKKTKELMDAKRTGARVCPKCKKKIEIKGARFCPFCATDVRSENEILADKVYDLIGLSCVIHGGSRDVFVATINEAVKFIKEA